MKKVLCVLLLLASCEDQVKLNPICGQSCYVDSTGKLTINPQNLVGACAPGTLVCEEEEFCVGYSIPSSEVCNGIDDDCDGVTDENLWQAFFGLENPCLTSPAALCPDARPECINGQYVCYSEYFGEEVCNGLDDNCDGQTDNDIVYPQSERYYYPADPETENVGLCRPGVKRCLSGQESYDGMVLPQTEICGTGIDEDCDGLTDEDDSGLTSRAFILVIDFSGSMSEEIGAVVSALCNFYSNPALASSKFALIGVSVVASNDDSDTMIVTDFRSPFEACIALTTAQTDLANTGDEYMIFPLTYYLEPYSSDLTWPEGYERNVILFTDEPYQSFGSRDFELDLFHDQCILPGLHYTAGLFADLDFISDWLDVLDPCSFWVEELFASTSVLEAKLLARFTGGC